MKWLFLCFFHKLFKKIKLFCERRKTKHFVHPKTIVNESLNIILTILFVLASQARVGVVELLRDDDQMTSSV